MVIVYVLMAILIMVSIKRACRVIIAVINAQDQTLQIALLAKALV